MSAPKERCEQLAEASPEHALYELALDLIEVYNNSRALRASC